MYTELDTVKNVLNIGDTSQDTLLTRLIKSATSFVNEVTHRTFEETTVTEKYAGTGTSELVLKNYPVSSITEITIDGDTVSSGDYELFEDEGIVFKYDYWTQANNTFRYGVLLDGNTNNRKRNIEVEYTYGYKLPGEANRDFPYSLEQVVINLVTTAYRESGEESNIKKEEVMSAKYEYFQTSISDRDMMILEEFGG